MEDGARAIGVAKRAGWAVLFIGGTLIMAYLICIPLGKISSERRLGTPEAILGAVLFGFIFLATEGYSLEGLSVGPAGVKAEINRIRDNQRHLTSDIRGLQFAIRGLVTKFELDHLRLLAAEGPATVRMNELLMSDLNRLDAIDFIIPTDGASGLNAIRQKYGGYEADFDLKAHVSITQRGREYLELVEALS
jgi:hypothetical protein